MENKVKIEKSDLIKIIHHLGKLYLYNQEKRPEVPQKILGDLLDTLLAVKLDHNLANPITHKKEDKLLNRIFEASKLITLTISGTSVVIKKKKNGLYLCKHKNGTNFEYPETELKKVIELCNGKD